MKYYRFLKRSLIKFMTGEIFYLLEVKLLSFFYKFLKLNPISFPYISGTTFRYFSDTIYYPGLEINPRPGDAIFVIIEELDCFIEQALPKINTPFKLVTHMGDYAVDEKWATLVENPLLIRWYAQNNFIRSPKVVSIPIGLEDAWRHNNGIVKDFNKLRSRDVEKIPRILYGFNEETNRNARVKAKSILSLHPSADWIRVSSRAYRKVLNRYMFVASPPGNGIDCHRTWEAMYLGCVPIVVGSCFYDGFPEFPGLVIDDWNDLLSLSESDLIQIYKKKRSRINEWEPLWMRYWLKKINNDE